MIDSLKQLEAELTALQQRVDEERARVRLNAIEQIKEMLESGTLSADDIAALVPKKPSTQGGPRIRGKAPAKYRNPETGDTWSGHGRPPLWLVGKNLSDYVIEKHGSAE
jgi:DNA-binding protein H-NS